MVHPGSVVLLTNERSFNPSRQTALLLSGAVRIGPQTKALCQQMFDAKRALDNARCGAIVGLSRKHPARLVEQVCAQSISNRVERLLEIGIRADNPFCPASRVEEFDRSHPEEFELARWGSAALMAGSGTYLLIPLNQRISPRSLDRKDPSRLLAEPRAHRASRGWAALPRQRRYGAIWAVAPTSRSGNKNLPRRSCRTGSVYSRRPRLGKRDKVSVCLRATSLPATCMWCRMPSPVTGGMIQRRISCN